MTFRDTTEIKNAIITAASITNDDHGILTAYLTLDYGGTYQAFGGYCLYTPKAKITGGNYAGHFIWRVLEIADVSHWDKLVGKTIRVKANWTKIEAIGHIIKDDWFAPAIDFKVAE